MRLTSVVGVIVVVVMMSACAEMIPTSPSLSSALPALSETRAVVALPSTPEPLPAVVVTPAPEPPPAAVVVTPEPEPPPPAVVVAPEPSAPPVAPPDPTEPAAPAPVDPTLIVCPAGTIATLGAAGIYCAPPIERFTCPTGTHPEPGETLTCVVN